MHNKHVIMPKLLLPFNKPCNNGSMQHPPRKRKKKKVAPRFHKFSSNGSKMTARPFKPKFPCSHPHVPPKMTTRIPPLDGRRLRGFSFVGLHPRRKNHKIQAPPHCKDSNVSFSN